MHYFCIKDDYEKTKELLDHEKITIKREKVKSFEELSIANFLYLNNINYIYEYEYSEFGPTIHSF